MAEYDVPGEDVRAIYLLPGSRLAAATATATHVFELDHKRECRHLQFGGDLTALDVAQDGQTIVTSNHDGLIELRDFATGAVMRELQKLDVPAKHLSFSPNGTTVAASLRNRTLVIFSTNPQNGIILCRGNQLDISALRFSPDGKTLAAAGRDGSVTLWDPIDGTNRLTFSNQMLPFSDIAFSASGDALIGISISGAVAVWRAP
jgi:WD40 repeat protein